jgi:1-aminocyclopropane-1-carboxylate deaminase
MNLGDFTIPIETIYLPIADKYGVSIAMARTDSVYPLASGNKLYKLLPNIDYAKQNNYQQLLSFGGAFSNHIHAFALFSQSIGMQSIAIIRGEKEYASNPTLSAATAAGMKLIFVDRATYRRRYDKDYLQQLQQQYPQALIIPEGGSSELALQGCTELIHQINKSCLQINAATPDVVTVACGTGMTFAGLVNGAQPHQSINGYLVVKDSSVPVKVDNLLAKHTKNKNYKIHSADLGGYAKFKAPLLDFILEFLQQTHILLDPIYTSKMCYCVMQQIKAGRFKAGSQLVMVHSGGLQAWYGMKRNVMNLAGDNAWQVIEKYL